MLGIDMSSSPTKDPPCRGELHVKSVESSKVLPLRAFTPTAALQPRIKRNGKLKLVNSKSVVAKAVYIDNQRSITTCKSSRQQKNKLGVHELYMGIYDKGCL
ncbi:hypothetical protein TNCV_150241 [Trichonephila clavipes]|nr:hypothetical protein TNCV_150241 [Trichonephila clavipes]